MICWSQLAAAAVSTPAVRMHLPRTVGVEGGTLQLGRLVVTRSKDEALLKKVSQTVMGRSPWLGEKIVIDRRTIMTRLAQSGITAADVKITGARAIVVTLKGKTIEAKDIIANAEALLQAKRPGGSDRKWRLIGEAKPMSVPAAEGLRLVPRMSKPASKSYVTVEARALVGARELGTARLKFRILHPTRKIVAKTQIVAGQMLSPENVEVKIVHTEKEPAKNWVPPYGMLASAACEVGHVVAVNLPAPARRRRNVKEPPLVRRNQPVQMKITRPGFTIRGMGLALSDGRVGELIRVRNIDSKRIIMVRVSADGTVSPLQEKR